MQCKLMVLWIYPTLRLIYTAPCSVRCVFTALLCVKRGWINAALSYALLEYKTKIVLALFASYIVGKVALSVVTLVPDIRKSFSRRAKREKAQAAPPQAANLLQALAVSVSRAISGSGDELQAFLGGLVARNRFIYRRGGGVLFVRIWQNGP
jgi:hypothetical protein